MNLVRDRHCDAVCECLEHLLTDGRLEKLELITIKPTSDSLSSLLHVCAGHLDRDTDSEGSEEFDLDRSEAKSATPDHHGDHCVNGSVTEVCGQSISPYEGDSVPEEFCALADDLFDTAIVPSKVVRTTKEETLKATVDPSECSVQQPRQRGLSALTVVDCDNKSFFHSLACVLPLWTDLKHLRVETTSMLMYHFCFLPPR